MINNKVGFYVLLILLVISNYVHAGELCPIPKKSIKSPEEAIVLAKKVIVAYQLTTISIDCLEVKQDSEYKKPGYELDVREIHSEQCGGDDLFSPLLMSINIKPSGGVTTTAGSDGTDVIYSVPKCKKLLQKQINRSR